MFRNYIKIAFRNLRRSKGYTLINIGGLALGLAACILIGLYVQNELSYDDFHEKGERIYRIGSNITTPNGSLLKGSGVGWPVGRTLEREYPAVKEVVYLRTYPRFSVKHNNRRFFEDMIYADDSFFKVFSFPLLDGHAGTALERPYSLVLTQEMAQKYFGNKRAVGKSLIMGDSLTFTVTAVVKVPEHSHIQFDILASFETICALYTGMCEENFSSEWFDLNVFNYVLLKKGASAKALRSEISNLVMKRSEGIEELGYTLKLQLEPLQQLYLNSSRGNSLGPDGNITYVYLLSVIAVFILLIACVNFMNLATARSMRRATEVGVRKAVGAERRQVAVQFLSEAVLVTFGALIAGLILARLTMPLFNELAGRTLAFNTLWSLEAIAVLFAGLVLVGMIAGSYPALVLSRFETARTLRGVLTTAGGRRLRKSLVIAQFIISSALIICTLVVLQQLDYMQSQDVGFQKENILVVDARRTDWDTRVGRYKTIKQELARHPAVISVSASNAVPGRTGWNGQVAHAADASPEESISTHYMAIDHDYVETFGLNIIAGRDFSKQFATDIDTALIINEVSVEAFGWGTPENAIGKSILSPSRSPEGLVIGVVENYHHKGLQEHIDPLVMDINPDAFGVFAVRFENGRASEVLEHAREMWRQFFPDYSFEYFFLDQDFAQEYASEHRLARIFGLFTGIAILIACLGLLGLAAFTAERRTKEIGIRKAMGAGVPGIVGLLSKDFLKLVLIGFVIAMPIAWYFMQQWLQDFAYRIDIGVGVFLLAGVLALLIALVTISWQSIRAALANPVDSLRSE
ncbi:MAG TPA: ABC transporter permease [Balneolaceae bacterium]